MEREWLRQRLDEGLSLEEIGRLTARHPSTVGYWLRHHGLVAAGSARYSARGPLA